MESHYWVALLTIGFFIVVITFLAALFFLIYASLQIKKAVVSMNEFMVSTDKRISPVLEEATETLRNLKVITGDVSAVTGAVREVSDSVAEVAENVRAANLMITELREQVSLRAVGIASGVRAALGVLLKHK